MTELIDRAAIDAEFLAQHRKTIADLTADREDLLAMVEELATAQLTRHDGRHHRDPQRDLPDMIEADMVDALQCDARALLKRMKGKRQ